MSPPPRRGSIPPHGRPGVTSRPPGVPPSSPSPLPYLQLWDVAPMGDSKGALRAAQRHGLGLQTSALCHCPVHVSSPWCHCVLSLSQSRCPPLSPSLGSPRPVTCGTTRVTPALSPCPAHGTPPVFPGMMAPCPLSVAESLCLPPGCPTVRVSPCPRRAPRADATGALANCPHVPTVVSLQGMRSRQYPTVRVSPRPSATVLVPPQGLKSRWCPHRSQGSVHVSPCVSHPWHSPCNPFRHGEQSRALPGQCPTVHVSPCAGDTVPVGGVRAVSHCPCVPMSW